MTIQFPERHPNLTLETKSENYFRSKLPQSWVVHKPTPDYGQDLYIEIEEDGQFRGHELIVQLKASHKYSGNEEFETISLAIATYNYLKNNLRVVMLVKYIETENDAYWMLLRDVRPPKNPEEQESFTVRIPRKNILSTINWSVDVVHHVKSITNIKLNAAKGASEDSS